MRTRTITLATAESGEWAGLYLDGKLEFQGQQVDAKTALELASSLATGFVFSAVLVATPESVLPDALSSIKEL